MLIAFLILPLLSLIALHSSVVIFLILRLSPLHKTLMICLCAIPSMNLRSGAVANLPPLPAPDPGILQTGAFFSLSSCKEQKDEHNEILNAATLIAASRSSLTFVAT